MTKLQI